MVNAISAIISELSRMSPQERRAFEMETGYNIDNVWQMPPKKALEYCTQHGIDLKDVSVFNDSKYKKAQANWNDAHTNYTTAYSYYRDLNSKTTKAEGLYNDAVETQREKNNGTKLTVSQDNEARETSGYTDTAINETNEAEHTANSWLDLENRYLDEQYHYMNYRS